MTGELVPHFSATMPGIFVEEAQPAKINVEIIISSLRMAVAPSI
jgi:hypothetical protein